MKKENKQYNQDIPEDKKEEKGETIKEEETNQVNVDGEKDADSYQTVFFNIQRKK